MTVFASIPWLCLCLAGVSLAAPAAMTLEEAGAALGSDVFKVREQAEQVIRQAGLAQFDQIERLTHSPDPEIAARARRCLPIVLLDIDERIPADLANRLRRIDELPPPELEQIIGELQALDPPRPLTLLALHSYWKAVMPEFTDTTHKLIGALENALPAALRGRDVPTEMERVQPARYGMNTLALVINGLCRTHGDEIEALLPLQACWTKAHPQLVTLLNADGYRLVICREATQAPDRSEALRQLLILGARSDLTNDQQSAVRRQLAEYREEAATLPVDSLDQDTGWYFFNVFGSDQSGASCLAAYRAYRKRFPAIAESSLLGQPLEVLLVLEQAGAGAAMDYALKQSVHGGVMVLGEWLHAHPESIREPLPLPQLKEGQSYPYRTVKFFRLFAPYADEEELNRHPEIAAAFKILTKDPRWQEVAKQARGVMAEQKGGK
jgi:hypothetical protein